MISKEILEEFYRSEIGRLSEGRVEIERSVERNGNNNDFVGYITDVQNGGEIVGAEELLGRFRGFIKEKSGLDLSEITPIPPETTRQEP